MLLLLMTLLFSNPFFHAQSAEVDNYYVYDANELADITDELNRYYNEVLRKTVAEWSPKKRANSKRFLKEFYKNIEQTALWSKAKFMIKENKLSHTDKEVEHIYKGAPMRYGPLVKLSQSTFNIRLNGVTMGVDKIGHFLDGGFLYYTIYQRDGDEDRAVRFSLWTEQTFFGKWTTGVFSNADLVANYEGMRFYRSIVEDDIVPGKKATIVFDSHGRPIFQEEHPIDLRHHVTEFWNEAILPSLFTKGMTKYVKKKLLQRCPDYDGNFEAISISEEKRQELLTRYQHLGLKENREFLITEVCQ